MASKFGRVVSRHGQGRHGWCVDFGRSVRPRYLTSARGARFESREMAQAILDAIRVKIAKGVDPQTAVDEFAPPTSERSSLQHWAGEYLTEQAELTEAGELSPTHLRELRRCVRPDGLWSWWYRRSLCEVDALAVAQYAKHLRGQKLSPKTVRNILGYFRAFLTWLARMERIERVPVFPIVKVKDHRPTIISPRTQALVLEQISRELRGAFLAACHGIRPGELRALNVRDLEDRSDVPGIVVSRAMKGPNANAVVGGTKTGDASWVPIDEELADWIVWRLGQTEGPFASRALFPHIHALEGPNPEYRWTANKLREVWNTAAAAVGVRVKMYEGTKHSSATAWRSNGMSLEVVRRMLRHRDARSTERYGKLADGALVEAFKRSSKR
jgi:integrase